MTELNPMDRCDCGHLRGHHNTYRDGIYYLKHTRCQFGGCGCPKFLIQPHETTGGTRIVDHT